MITAPYNFVPLNKEVYYPEWADEVNHDIPFEDGESAEIEITIEAMSPIFIRNHSKDKENPSKEFCHYKQPDGSKQYYIPGSSIKGMVRSVMEIMSFAKMELVNDATLSVRDMTNRKELVGQANGCGFLVKTENGYILEDCGKPTTISHHEIKNITGKWLKKFSSAKEKYQQTGMLLHQITFKKKTATLVFTGQINNKKNEFVFIPNGNIINLKQEVVNKFKTVYFNEKSIDGSFWEQKHKSDSKIPVFYRRSQSGQITAIGLTQLFKLAYNNTIRQAIRQDQKDAMDLPQTIFGTVNKKMALKGRVQFSHLASTHVTFEQEKEEILGTPNPTYYPNYIEQTKVNGDKVIQYTTLMDTHATIRGYKRYPLHQNITSSHKTNENEKVRTHFKPLDKGSKFRGKIRFHNLKKVEIGALISAITFHGQENQYYHNIGMAKSLGYGKIKIEIDLKNLKYTKNDYLQAFETEITKSIPNWQHSPQLKELFAMTNKDIDLDNLLHYQRLENDKKKNDFVEAKKNKEFLKSYSQFLKKSNSSQQSAKHKQNQTQVATDIISKSKMRKALSAYWDKHYGIFFHPNQIAEFLSDKGFVTTPPEQQEVYIRYQNDQHFIALIKMVHMFFNNKLDQKTTQKLYTKLINDAGKK